MPTSFSRRRRTPARVLRAGFGSLVALATVLGLSACAAGVDAQTVQVYNAPAGTDLRGPDVDALGTVIVTSGEAATLSTGLAGPSDSDDALTAVAVSDEEGTSYPSTIAGGTLPIPAGTLVQTADDASVSISGDELEPGTMVTVRLTFERGAPVSGDVPVVAREGPYADVPTPAATSTRTTPEGADEPTGP